MTRFLTILFLICTPIFALGGIIVLFSGCARLAPRGNGTSGTNATYDAARAAQPPALSSRPSTNVVTYVWITKTAQAVYVNGKLVRTNYFGQPQTRVFYDAGRRLGPPRAWLESSNLVEWHAPTRILYQIGNTIVVDLTNQVFAFYRPI